MRPFALRGLSTQHTSASICPSAITSPRIAERATPAEVATEPSGFGLAEARKRMTAAVRSRLGRIASLLIVATVAAVCLLTAIPAHANCTPWFNTNGISFTSGQNSTNQWFYANCKAYSQITGGYEPLTYFTWTLTTQTSEFFLPWQCTQNGYFYTYAASCTWNSPYVLAGGDGVPSWNPSLFPVAGLSAVNAPFGSTAGIRLTVEASLTSGPAVGQVVTFGLQGAGVTGSFNPATCTLDSSGICSTTYTPTGSMATGSNLLGITAATSTFRATGSVTIAPVTALGSTSATQTVSPILTAAATLHAISIVGDGVAGAEFQLIASSGVHPCGTGTSYYAGEYCTVGYTFTPAAPGERRATIVLTDASGNVMGTVPISGIGTGPLAAFVPPTPTVAPNSGSNFNNKTAIAADASGNLWSIGPSSAQLSVWLPAGTTYTYTDATNSLQTPVALALDSAGNVYIADTTAKKVFEYAAPALANGSSITLLRSFTMPDGGTPSGVAVDSVGNVYIADFGTPGAPGGIVVEFPIAEMQSQLNGTYFATEFPSAFPDYSPESIAVDSDGDGNLFIGYGSNSTNTNLPYISGPVVQAASSAGAYTQTVILPSASNAKPGSIAVGPGGNVYVGSDANGQVLELSPSSGNYTQSAITNLSHDAAGLAADGRGNVYVIDPHSGNLYLAQSATPPAITFPTATAPGSTDTADGPQTLAVVNAGNAALTLSPPVSGKNPSMSTGFTLGGASTCPQLTPSSSPTSLAAGETCTEIVSFAPVAAGVDNGSLVFTDDSQNVTGSTQSISLSGTGAQASLNVSQWPAASSIGFGQTLASSSLSGGTANVAGQFAWTASSTAPGVGVQQESVTFTPTDLIDYAAVSHNVSVTVNRAVPAVNWPPPVFLSSGQPLAAGSLGVGGATNPYSQGWTVVDGVFTWNAPSTVPPVGVAQYAVTFTPTDSTDYVQVTDGSVLVIDTVAPTLATTNLGANQVTVQITSVNPGQAALALLQGENAACGTPQQTGWGVDGNSNPAFAVGSLNLASGVTSSYTFRNLAQSSGYRVCVSDAGWGFAGQGFSTTAEATLGSGWSYVGGGVVSPTAASSGKPSLAFAPDGTPYLAFPDGSNNHIVTVMKYSGGSWTNVGAAPFSTDPNSDVTMAFAPDGTPYVSFTDCDSNNCYHNAYAFDGSNWRGKDYILFNALATSPPAFALTPAGIPATIYENSNGLAQMREGNNVGVVGSSFPAAVSYNVFPSPLQMAFSANGTPYVAYGDFGPEQSGGQFDGQFTVRALNSNTKNWDLVGSEAFGGAGNSMGFALSSGGVPYIAYDDSSLAPSKLTAMAFDGSRWRVVGAQGFTANAVDHVSLAMAPDGTPFVAFKDGDSAGSVQAYLNSTWTSVGGAFTNAAPGSTQIVFAPDGTPYVAFLDNSTGSGGYPAVVKLGISTTATTAAATSITASAATLNGTVNDGGLNATVSFDYGATASYGTTLNASAVGGASGDVVSAGSGATATSVGLSGLNPNTTYHFRVDATTISGTVNGSDLNFTTQMGTPVVTVSPATITYGDTPATLTATVAYAGSVAPTGAVSFMLGGGGTVTGTCVGSSTPLTCTASLDTGALPAAAHGISVYIASDANFNSASNTNTLTINQATPSVTVTPYSVTYDGNAHTATGSATGIGGASLSATGFTLTATTHTNAGSYSSDAWSFTDASGNYATASGTVSDSIAKATPSVTVTPYSVTYDGNAHTATGSATGIGGVTLSAAGFTFSGTTHTNAGTYALDGWSFTDASGNYATASGTVSDAIAKATPSVTVTPYSVTYDGNAHMATGSATGAGGAALSAGGFNLGGTAHTSAGTYGADAWSFTDASGNYNSASGTVSDSIGKATPSVTVTPYGVTYDGNAHTAAASATGVGGVPLTFTGFTLSGTTHTNAGTYASDAWSFTDASGNYNSASGTVSDSIGKATPSVTVTPYSLTYDGNAQTATASATGVGGVALSASGFAMTGTTHTNAGIYAADAWSFNDASGNYAIASGTVIDTITKATPLATVTPYSVTYDGNAHTATATATGVGGIALSATGFTLGATTHTNSGTYSSDAWSFSDASGNYAIASGTVIDTITKATPLATVTPYSVTYDANAHTASGAATGVGGAALSAAGFNLSATMHTSAGTYNSDAWSFTDASGNYSTVTGTASDAIAKATPSVSWAAPSAIVYGTALSSTQLNATASVPGGFSYSPASGVILGAGTQTLSLTFTPTDTVDYNTVPKSVQLQVNAAATTTVVSTSANVVILTNPVTFTATVTSAGVTPTGSVDFLDGSTVIGSGTLSAGTAQFTTSTLTAGSHTITAAYVASTNFLASTSGPITQTILDFGLTSSDPGSGSGAGGSPVQTVIPGGSATYQVQIAPSAGFTLPIAATLTITGLPAGATVTLNNASWPQLSPTSWQIPANTSLSTFSLTIQLPQQARMVNPMIPGDRVPPLLFALLLLPFTRRMRVAAKRLARAGALILMLAAGAGAIGGLAGCGSPDGFFAQTPKTYTVVVTVTAGSLSHSSNLTLIVQ